MTPSSTKKNENNIDRLALYFRQDYVLDDKIIIHQPTIGDILEIGEKEFFSTLKIFTTNTTEYRLPLWKMGIDWNKMSDFDLFITLASELKPNRTTKLLFGDIDFSSFVGKKFLTENGEKESLFYNYEEKIMFDEEKYLNMREYLRCMFNIHPKVEKVKGKEGKELVIWEETQKLKNKKENENDSTMLSLVSFYINHPGSKYKTNELKEVGIAEFMDSIQRLQIYEYTSALHIGAYNGFTDTSNIDPEKFDFMRDIK